MERVQTGAGATMPRGVAALGLLMVQRHGDPLVPVSGAVRVTASGTPAMLLRCTGIQSAADPQEVVPVLVGGHGAARPGGLASAVRKWIRAQTRAFMTSRSTSESWAKWRMLPTRCSGR